jgi:hypothetical protein
MTSEAFNDLCKSLREDEWVTDFCTLRCARTGVEIWTANIPIVNTFVYQPTVGMTIWQKIRIQPLMRAANSRQLQKQLKRGTV